MYEEAGPDTGVDTLHKVEGPLGGPGVPGPTKGRRRKINEQGKKKEKKGKKGKKRREKKRENEKRKEKKRKKENQGP